jgi:anaerobic ribonucleoside-triphosphate reductase activating protein
MVNEVTDETACLQSMRIHRFIPQSLANGPGMRAVLWLQGCTLHCPGCYNPQTHPLEGGELCEVPELLQHIHALGETIEGVTISGGEPLLQFRPLLWLLQAIRHQSCLSTIVFSGYQWEEILTFNESQELLACIDVLICGRFLIQQRLAAGLRGSTNKRVELLTARYTLAEIELVPTTEVIVMPDGTVISTGIEPVIL